MIIIAILQQTSICQQLEKGVIARRKVAGATSSFNAFQRSQVCHFQNFIDVLGLRKAKELGDSQALIFLLSHF